MLWRRTRSTPTTLVGLALVGAASLALGACSGAAQPASAPNAVVNTPAPTTPGSVTPSHPTKPPMPSSLPVPPPDPPRTPYLDTVGDSRQDSPPSIFFAVNSAGLILDQRFIQVYGGNMGLENPVDPGRSGVATFPSDDLQGHGGQWHYYPMSSDHGPLRVVAVAGSVVSLTDKAGEVVKFDAATNAFVN